MFIDEAVITVKGGRGGDGKVAFFANRSGPSGGNGGHGGNVYAVTSNNITHLKKFIEITKFEAEKGFSGDSNKRAGHNGEDLLIPMPAGTTIIDLETKREIELNDFQPKILLAYGGRGGRGNYSFKSATNQTPRKSEKGSSGELKQIKLILKLIADFGLIGLPNAGKSSLLNLLTNANVKTAAYPFTTLEPNLGVINGKVIADIPGLIEGASMGKGLGIKFLKHIEKVRLLIHCISSESNNLNKDYETVINEINRYNKFILKKESIILLTKVDLLSEKEIGEKIKILKTINPKIFTFSIYKKELLNNLIQYFK